MLASRARLALAAGARSIMLLGGEPTIHLPSVLEFVSLLPADARLIWKTNGHGSTQAHQLLAELFDVWLVDYKFGNDSCAKQLARVDDYTQSLQGNLIWAAHDSELVIRHLLMPGHLDCCWRPVAAWIASHLPEIKVNLRTGFWPAWQARKHVEFEQPVSGSEVEQAWQIATALKLRTIA